MHIKHKGLFSKVVILVLCVALLVPTYAMALETGGITSRASNYLTSYQAYVYQTGNGKIQVEFDVTCVN